MTVFDGKEITLIDAAHNVYATAPQRGTVDQSVDHFVSGLGMRLPPATVVEPGSPPVTVDGTQYYKCGAAWYTAALSSTGISCVKVAPPPGK